MHVCNQTHTHTHMQLLIAVNRGPDLLKASYLPCHETLRDRDQRKGTENEKEVDEDYNSRLKLKSTCHISHMKMRSFFHSS